MNPVHVLALWFGAGTSPYAPGTIGSLLAFPVFFLLNPLPLWLYVLITCVLFLLGILICGRTASDMGVHDHSAIVFDEVVGMLFTLAMVPVGWMWLVIGFLLFRIFDIWKPFPISILDRKVPGGLGIMLDDLIAAIYAWLVLQASFLLFQSFVNG